jgi:hypothetical protein
MRNLRFPLSLAVLAVALPVGQAEAQVVVRTPFVTVVVPGRPAYAPLPAPVVMPGRAVIVEPGSPPPVPLETVPVRPVPPVVSATRAPSLADFAATFRPAPTGGRYEVVVQHPCTCCPVKVSFCLPRGCPRKVRACSNSLEIRYGLCKAVVVRFLPDGSVRVRD